MKERPIGILVDALRFIGAEIIYKEKDGFPPVETRGFSKQENSNITIRGDISSQYISALLMVAPHLPQGLRIQISGEIGSKPYIEMTLALMRQFGAKFEWQDDRTILVQPMPYRKSTFSIESDWSAASYWFAITALADPCEVSLRGLKPNSLQGDSRIVDMMDPLGVNADFDDRGLLLTKKEHKDNVEFDFTASPDLAQTVAVTCALKGIKCRMTGLHSLRIKETDRIAALQTELQKIRANLVEEQENAWYVEPAPPIKSLSPIRISTYDDHRMAMAFAPLATMVDVMIEEPDVVQKSYPDFWIEMQKAGFKTEIRTV
jgi:3-phosphoshikimate 1-carboxyvinyltransferase